MQKISEGLTTSIQMYPTTTSAISSTALVDMRDFEKCIVKVMGHRLPDQKGEGIGSVTIYESDSGTTWSASATLLTAGTTYATVSSVTDLYAQTEIRADQMSMNANKRYLGVRATMPTGTVLSIVVERANGGSQ